MAGILGPLIGVALTGVFTVVLSRMARRRWRLYSQYSALDVLHPGDVHSKTEEPVAVEGTVETDDVDGGEPVYRQVEREMHRMPSKKGRRWRPETTRINAEPFQVAADRSKVAVDPEWLRRRHDLTVGDSNTAPSPRTSSYLQFDDVRTVGAESERAGEIHAGFPELADDAEGGFRRPRRYRVASVEPGDDVLVAGVPERRDGDVVLAGGDDHMVLADQGIDSLRGSLRSDALWTAAGAVTVGLVFLVALGIASWEFLGSQMGLELLRWLLG